MYLELNGSFIVFVYHNVAVSHFVSEQNFILI
jgi:hypothetical protein